MALIGIVGWGRQTDPKDHTKKITVPSPADTPGAEYLWDLLSHEVPDGVDFLQCPPWSLAQGGDNEHADGYGVQERRQLNGTRYGGPHGAEKLMAMVATLNNRGVRVLGDAVLHQLIGDTGGPGLFQYRGADGKSFNGRGQTSPGWFRAQAGETIPPFCAEDDVPSPKDDVPFGREISHQHCTPANVTISDAIDYMSWVQGKLGTWGWRIDDAKGIWPQALRRIVDAIRPSMAYAEYYDTDPQLLGAWALGSPMDSHCGLEDFQLKYRLQDMCNSFDCRRFFSGSEHWWQIASNLAVGFVENPDTDTSPGAQTIFNKVSAYAIGLTLPMKAFLIYGRDYFPTSVLPNAYGMKTLLDPWIWCSKMVRLRSLRYRVRRQGRFGRLARWCGGRLWMERWHADGGEPERVGASQSETWHTFRPEPPPPRLHRPHRRCVD